MCDMMGSNFVFRKKEAKKDCNFESMTIRI